MLHQSFIFAFLDKTPHSVCNQSDIVNPFHLEIIVLLSWGSQNSFVTIHLDFFLKQEEEIAFGEDKIMPVRQTQSKMAVSILKHHCLQVLLYIINHSKYITVLASSQVPELKAQQHRGYHNHMLCSSLRRWHHNASKWQSMDGHFMVTLPSKLKKIEHSCIVCFIIMNCNFNSLCYYNGLIKTIEFASSIPDYINVICRQFSVVLHS